MEESEDSRIRLDPLGDPGGPQEGKRKPLLDEPELHRRIFAAANDAIFVLDPREDRIIEANPKAALMLGYAREELVGMPASVIHPEEMERFRKFVARVREIGSGFTNELTCRARDGRRVPVEISASILIIDGAPFIVAMARDVSDRRHLEEALRESEEQYTAFFEEAPIAYFSVGADGRILRANHRAAELLCCAQQDLVGLPVLDLYAETAAGKARARGLFERFLRDETLRDEELEMRRADGASVWVSLTVRPICDSTGRVVESRSMAVDITDRKRSLEVIQHLAYHDPLTNLPNRRLLSDRLNLALAQAGRSGKHVAVLFLDLDDFKRINDSLGHTMGDRLLQAVATRLSGSVRPYETVARQGGDEFMVLVPDLNRAEEAGKVAERVLTALRVPWLVDVHAMAITASIGIALSPQHGEDAETLLRNADAALYQAKEAGRNCWRLFGGRPPQP
ncbi:MAG: diguanylate cyclase [Chloroflexi bacterium]|nr:diguanylate cyclase [Chloroflexota bacterium]